MRKELYFMVGGFLEIYLVLFGIIFINLKKKKKKKSVLLVHGFIMVFQ